MSLINHQNKAFGLDISDGGLRLAQLGNLGKKVSLRAYSQVALPPGCVVDGEIKETKIFLEKLNELTRTKKGPERLSRQVVAVLPEDKTFLKTINLPAGNIPLKQKIAELIPQLMPLDIDDIYFDWQPVKKTAAEQSVLVGASPKYIVDSYFNILTKAGLTPIALEIEAASIARLLIEHNGEQEPQIIIDMGASRTGLFLYDEGMIKFTISLPISGDMITELIAESLDLDKEKSEKAKVVCGLDRTKCHGALLEIMGPTLDDLAERINKAVIFYRANFANANKIEKLVLCGGGANFLGIADVLKEKTALSVTASNPLKNIDCPFAELRSPKIQSFISALGLALRGLNLKNYL